MAWLYPLVRWRKYPRLRVGPRYLIFRGRWPGPDGMPREQEKPTGMAYLTSVLAFPSGLIPILWRSLSGMKAIWWSYGHEHSIQVSLSPPPSESLNLILLRGRPRIGDLPYNPSLSPFHCKYLLSPSVGSLSRCIYLRYGLYECVAVRCLPVIFIFFCLPCFLRLFLK